MLEQIKTSQNTKSKTVKFRYGRSSYSLDVPVDTPVLTSRIDELKSSRDGLEIVKEAMDHPIDSPRLAELAKGKPDAVIIISDHTRPVPSRDILPNMIRELHEGNPDIRITLLVATGFHRETTADELREKLGDELYEEYRDRIIVHDAHDPSRNVKIGTLPSGPDCIIDKAAAEASLLIAEGFIEPHFFAGFSGGRKSVLPGICDAVTVMGNHCSKFIDSPYARTGILDGNPIHKDMIAAAKMAKLAYIVNVVIDENKKTVAAFAGNMETAHRKGCEFIASYAVVKPAMADIVITTNGGYPLDQNAYQSYTEIKLENETAAYHFWGGARDIYISGEVTLNVDGSNSMNQARIYLLPNSTLHFNMSNYINDLEIYVANNATLYYNYSMLYKQTGGGIIFNRGTLNLPENFQML